MPGGARATMPPAMFRLLLSLCAAPAYRAWWRALLLLLVAVITWLALSPAPPKTMDTGWGKKAVRIAIAIGRDGERNHA